MQQTYIRRSNNFRQKLNQESDSLIIIMMILFVASTFVIKPVWSSTINNLVVAYSLLIIALLWSKKITNNLTEKIAISLGKCSLGIYLVHAMVIPLLRILITLIFPTFMTSVSISSVIVLSIPSFFVSWLIVSWLMKRRLAAKYLFTAN